MKLFLDKNGVEITTLTDEQKANALANIIVAIPRYAARKNNNVYSYTFKECMRHSKEIPDGHIIIWDYEFNSCGWASGSNYYGVGYCKDPRT